MDDGIKLYFEVYDPGFSAVFHETADYMKENAGSSFVFKKNFTNTAHALWSEMPHEVA